MLNRFLLLLDFVDEIVEQIGQIADLVLEHRDVRGERTLLLGHARNEIGQCRAVLQNGHRGILQVDHFLLQTVQFRRLTIVVVDHLFEDDVGDLALQAGHVGQHGLAYFFLDEFTATKTRQYSRRSTEQRTRRCRRRRRRRETVDDDEQQQADDGR